MDHGVRECVDVIRQRWAGQPRAAIILGTGLGGLASHIEAEEIFSGDDLPALPRPTAVAHAGRVVCGALAGVPVIAMQGRGHYYEGFDLPQITLPLRVAAQLGCRLLIVSNASGGLNPQFRSGDIMAIDDHIDWMGRLNAAATVLPLEESSGTDSPPRPPRTDYYDDSLIEQALECGRRENFACHRGVYVGVTGPNYETRAEYRLMRRIGGDAVGMSTVPEVITARRAGMRVLALSAITNIARPDTADTVDAMDVVDIAEHAEPKLRSIVFAALTGL